MSPQERIEFALVTAMAFVAALCLIIGGWAWYHILAHVFCEGAVP